MKEPKEQNNLAVGRKRAKPWTLPQKIKTELLYNPAISLSDIYLKELKSGSQTDISTFMLIATLFTIDKMWKQAKYPFNR